MKKADFIILSAVFGVLLLLFACRKDIDFMLQGKEAPPSAVLETAKVWHLKHLDKGIRRHLTPRWDGSWTEQSTSGERLLVVPAREKRVNNKDIKIRRVFIFNASGGVVSEGRIVEFLGMKYDVDENLRFLVRNYDRSAIADFDGGIMQYDINYRPLENATYKGGRKLESATTEVITRTGAEFQKTTSQGSRKMMSMNTTSSYCPPVTPDMVGFPPLQDDCFYTMRRVTTIDNDTGCVIDLVYIYISHWCESDEGGESGTATASASGSHDDDPPYGGGGGGGDDPEPEEPQTINVVFCEGISSENKIIIKNTLSEAVNENCATLTVNNALAGVSGLTLGICMDENNQGDTYSTTTKVITFQTTTTIARSDIMMHELFHAYQDNVAYPNGIDDYTKDTATGDKAPGFSNIEFERALFTDITMLHGSNATALYFSDNGTIKDDYESWIDSLTNEGTEYPDFSANWSSYETEYYIYMEEFKNSHPSYEAPIINTLEPEALKEIFNGLLQPGCEN